MLLAASSILTSTLTGCLEEAFPQNSQVTGTQLENVDKAGLASAIPAYMTAWTTDYYWDLGFMGFGIWRDVMTADFPVYDSSYEYYYQYGTLNGIGNVGVNDIFWQRYYYLIQKCNSVLTVSDQEPGSADSYYVGNALGVRAAAYLDMGRMYEYFQTGFAALDELAESRKIYGLTVPIVDENTTEAQSRVLYRAPYYQLYRFILTDLNKAEQCLASYRTATSKTEMCLGTIYGLKARFWLEVGTRFELQSTDLAAALQMESNEQLASYDRLGIATANDCYRLAAEYARKAINEGFTPLTKTQWFDKTSGFNTPNAAWMWCITISPDNTLATNSNWQSFVSFTSPEPNWGVCTPSYSGGRMINSRLYGEMDANDWRRSTWIDPEEVGSEEAYTAKYAAATSLSYTEFAALSAYVGFKFHPAGGDRTTSANGNAVSVPLMRVEEMYLIEAEAVARGEGAGAGKALLETFMNSFRMEDGTTYSCTTSQRQGVIDEIFKQKRIELWGEGLILWDYRRMKKAIERGYPGTNQPAPYQYNSLPGFVAPWTNIYIPDRVHDLNSNIILNPDPSQSVPKWSAN